MSIRETLEMARRTIRPLAAKKLIDLRFESEDQIGSVPMDAARIKQVPLKPGRECT